MKKIVLGCAAVLLSLGLLAGCNNKEDEPPITEAVSLSVSQTSVNLEPGGSAEVTYTVSPEKATVMALSDHEEYVTAVAQEGTIYLEAVAAGTAIVSVGAEYEDYASAEAQITVTVAEVVEPGPATPTVSLALTKSTLNLVLPTEEETQSGETGAEVIGYEVTPTEAEGTIVDMEVTESTPTEEDETEAVVTVSNLEDGWTAIPQVPGTAEITVTATCEGYNPAEATIEVVVHEYGWEPTFEGLTIVFTLENTSGQVFAHDDSISVYAAGDYNNWEGDPVKLDEGEDNTYIFTCDFLPEDDTYIELLPGHNEEGADWNKILGTYTFEFGTDVDGTITDECTVTVQNYDSWDDVFPTYTGTTNFYIVVYEAADNIDESTLASTYTKISGASKKNGDNNGYPYFGSSSDGVATTSGTISSNSQPYVYNSTVGIASAEQRGNNWISLHDGSWSGPKIDLEYYTGDIPDTADGTYAVFSFVLDTSSTSDDDWVEGAAVTGIEGLNRGWVTGVASLEAYFALVTGPVGL